ncbi:HIT family protein [Aldersonia kunmingensis]|uniref:HIT family protein n=1 Tax=Aldersonia kunmingensis TaxID=408066 RepID=UPI000834CEDA|nr:HIT family protein [Aldersonia kunmingensis]
MSSCIFCQIVRGEAPATRVYEDDDFLAFLDIRPITRGHTLVIPKQHSTELEDLDRDAGARLFRLGHHLALAMRRSDLAADGANLALNDGTAAFQTVGHVHLHVVPRQHGDKLRFATGLVLRRSKDAEATAAAIRTGLRKFESEGS